MDRTKEKKDFLHDRYRKVYNKYLSVVSSYGNIARNIPQETFYQEVADETGYASRTVRYIIAKVLKGEVRLEENSN